MKHWRQRVDSDPRWTCAHSELYEDQRLKPLGHTLQCTLVGLRRAYRDACQRGAIGVSRSKPRGTPLVSFQDRCLKPLGHPSKPFIYSRPFRVCVHAGNPPFANILLPFSFGALLSSSALISAFTFLAAASPAFRA